MNITGNLDTREGREALPIIQSMIPWTEKIYDMTEEQIKEYKSAFREDYHSSEEKKTREVIDVYYIEYQYFQLRKDYNWVLDQFALSGDKMAIRREILLQRLRGSNNSAISAEDIEYLISNMKKSTNDLLICGKWLYKLYEHGAGYQFGRPKDLDENIPYLVGIDPAGGGGGDNFSVYIINPFNLKIAAEFKSPYISGPNAVRMLIELVHEYIPKAVLIPEKNSMGIYLIQMLLETDIRDNLYWSRKAQELEELTSEDGTQELKSLSEQYRKYGTFLSKKVRDAMFELLFQHVDVCKDILTTEYLVDDLCKLIKTSTGRIEADKGEHDDCVMAYLHAIYIYYTGDNLETFGIIKGDNPLYGPIQLPEEPPAGGITSQEIALVNSGGKEVVSYDAEVMDASARMESQIRTLCDTLSFMNDPVYSKEDRDFNPSDTVDLGSWFFDDINGTGGIY